MAHSPLLQQYWNNQQHLTIIDDLLLFDDRIVFPRDMRLDILNRLHEGHQGITKTRALASSSVWWPSISAQIEEMIDKCNTCAKHRPVSREPLLPSSFPERPWSRLGMDLFDFEGKTYLVIVDYYSRWIEIRPLEKQSSAHTISKIKSVLAVHGIPDIIVSDNGPQFASTEFRAFAAEYGFTHTTSSPRYPQSNGEAERAVQTVKRMLKKSKDPYAALLLYRATPLRNGLSPSELLMGRKLKTKIPILPSSLLPSTPDHSLIQQKESNMKAQQQAAFNKRHAARQAPPLRNGDTVFIRDMNKNGQVVAEHPNPRSFLIKTAQGIIRRNRSHLVAMPGETPPPQGTTTTGDATRFSCPPSPPAPDPQQAAFPQQHPPQQPTPPRATSLSPEPAVDSPPGQVRTRSGRLVNRPVRLDL